MSRYGFYDFRPYVPVAKRQANAAKYAAKIAKKEKRELAPVKIAGRKITNTFWGTAWCDNLEHYSDYANRLPRGRSYARNGSVVDLQIAAGRIEAIVAGSDVYKVAIEISQLKSGLWKQIKADCAQSIASLMDLLAGKLSSGVMRRLTQPKDGLFPQPSEIKIRCSCPDWAGLCKHSAACLYGVGARLDSQPELLCRLRGIDHQELVSEAIAQSNLQQTLSGGDHALDGANLGEMFGIELESGQPPKPNRRVSTSPTKTSQSKAASPKKKATATKAKPTVKKTVKKVVPKAKPSAKPAKRAATTQTKASTKPAVKKAVAKKPAAKKAAVKKTPTKLSSTGRRKAAAANPFDAPIADIMILL